MLPVGSVVASLLLERDFKDEMKKIARDQVWELAASQRIPNGRLQEIIRNNTDYKELNPQNVATLPDMRGAFLRGLHGGRPDDNRGDAGDPRRLIGSYQADAFGRHEHNLSPTYPNKP